MTTSTNPRIEQAAVAVEAELDCIEAEREAFGAFRRRLARFDVDATRTDGGSIGIRRDDAGLAGDGRLQLIRDAYRETVMDTSHYEDDYNEAIHANMAVEFGPELAAYVTSGSPLIPTAYRALIEATKAAERERSDFAAILKRERRSLDDVDGALATVECEAHEICPDDPASVQDLPERRRRLTELERECGQIAKDRQDLVHDRSVSAIEGIDGSSLVGYLYDSLDVTCPALAATAEVADSINRIRWRCVR